MLTVLIRLSALQIESLSFIKKKKSEDSLNTGSNITNCFTDNLMTLGAFSKRQKINFDFIELC